MPLPERKKGETESDFMGRCMANPVMNRDFPDAKQRWAVCNKQADKPGKAEARGGGLPALLEYVSGSAWAMAPDTLTQMLGIVERHLSGGALSAAEIEAAIGRPSGQVADEVGYRVEEGVGVLPISGMIAKYTRMLNDVSLPRGTSVEAMRANLDEALADPMVRSVLLLIDSPGGQAAGVADLADEIRAANAQKPVVAYIDDLGASGAYWLASAAGEVYANAAGMVGSIGVYTVLIDASRRAEQMGLKFHVVKSGEHKGAGTPGTPVTDAQLAERQNLVDGLHGMFQAAILSGRGSRISAETLAGVADGRLFLAERAAAYGLIDAVATYDEALARARELGDGQRAAGNGQWKPAGGAGTNLRGETTMVNEKQIEDAAAAVKAAEDKARSEGAKAERARIAAINAALPEAWAEAARGKAVADGLDAARAESLALAGARAEITRLRGEATERDKKLAAIAAGGVKPLEQKAGDDQAEARAKAKAAETAKDPAGQFDAQVADLTRDGKTSKAAAQLRIAAERPDLHQAWLARANAPRL